MVYDEKDAKIIEQMMKNCTINRSYMRRNTEYYSDAIKSYDAFIKMIAKFISDLKLADNNVALSILIRILIYDGYFSKDNYFLETDKKHFYDVRFYEGMDIINGNGCCRHLAEFYDQIFKKLGIQSDIISCYTGGYDCTLEDASLKDSNHATNLITFDGVDYIYDCIRECLLRFVDEFMMEEIIQGEKPYRFYYKYSHNVVKNGVTYDLLADKLARLRIVSKMKTISYETYLDFEKEAKGMFYKNYDMFGDLKNESKKHVRKICDELKKGYQEEVTDFYRHY